MSAPQQPWGPPPQQPVGGPPRRPPFSWLALVAAVVAGAALLVAVIGLVRPSSSSGPVSTPAPISSAAPTPSADTSNADRTLCTAIAPLLAEDDQMTNAWTGSGPTGTPARDGALSKYQSDTEDWAGRIQPVLDSHKDANAFLVRTLQRFIDDRILMARNMKPGPSQPYDDEAYADSMTAYGGPLFVCWKLGVKW